MCFNFAIERNLDEVGASWNPSGELIPQQAFTERMYPLCIKSCEKYS